MARFMVSTSESDRPRRVNAGGVQAHLADAEPTIKAGKLRELAAWYRAFAARAGNPVIWESRLLTADDLEAEASRIDPNETDELRPPSTAEPR
jgi:hypothetical protein